MNKNVKISFKKQVDHLGHQVKMTSGAILFIGEFPAGALMKYRGGGWWFVWDFGGQVVCRRFRAEQGIAFATIDRCPKARTLKELKEVMADLLTLGRRRELHKGLEDYAKNWMPPKPLTKEDQEDMARVSRALGSALRGKR